MLALNLPLDRLVVVGPHFGVEAALRQQLGVGALLHRAALIQDDDPVRPHHGGQAVGDHDHRLAGRQAGQGLLDQRLVLGVGESGGLVAVASSSTTMGASFRMARARAMRCASPPER